MLNGRRQTDAVNWAFMKTYGRVEAGQLRPKGGWATAVDPEGARVVQSLAPEEAVAMAKQVFLPGRQSANGRAHCSKG